MYRPTLRYNIINLNTQKWVTSAGKYSDAVRIATEWEQSTGQLHGIEQG